MTNSNRRTRSPVRALTRFPTRGSRIPARQIIRPLKQNGIHKYEHLLLLRIISKRLIYNSQIPKICQTQLVIKKTNKKFFLNPERQLQHFSVQWVHINTDIVLFIKSICTSLHGSRLVYQIQRRQQKTRTEKTKTYNRRLKGNEQIRIATYKLSSLARN